MPRAKKSGIHRYAIALTALLFTTFVVATALNASYGGAVVLRVFEENQLHRANISRGMKTVVHLADYVRVDPTSIDMRGRLVDALIENNRRSQALDVALAGLQATLPDELPLAQLVVVRAAIAVGDSARAGETLDTITQQPDKTAEAWFHVATFSAAHGDFTRMHDAFDRLSRADDAGSTQQFIDERIAARSATPASPDISTRVRALLILGRLDDALSMISASEVPVDDPRLQFWRGVHEDLQGRPAAARTLYERAAARGDSLAKIALTRP